jgi:hypothetical protein
VWEEVGTEDLDKALELGEWAALPLTLAAFWHAFPAIGQLIEMGGGGGQEKTGFLTNQKPMYQLLQESRLHCV